MNLEHCSRVLKEVRTCILDNLRHLPHAKGTTLLDVGCWDGSSTVEYGAVVGAAHLQGVEVFETQATMAKAKGIGVAPINLERDAFPWMDESVDYVVCNQVLEHLKNVWLPLSEIHRVLKPARYAIFSVPNLASLHNRILLAVGHQPTSIRTFGPHVRGYTLREFRNVVTYGGAFEVIATRGVGFPPVPPPWSSPLSRLIPGAAHTSVLVVRKTSAAATWRSWLDVQLQEGVQTLFEDGRRSLDRPIGSPPSSASPPQVGPDP